MPLFLYTHQFLYIHNWALLWISEIKSIKAVNVYQNSQETQLETSLHRDLHKTNAKLIWANTILSAFRYKKNRNYNHYLLRL